ncbi:carbohydrate ABC transporter permease [Actinoallomurus iriomotensis]|jgi:multiple sugar transport system permease protein|uniref:Sugar ABC transporter permease n=1 Tax=Actinoallomurus iriomotensis TaxID=478107 RepID=A0A9W6RLA6_9ACTN|nr:carbohydrate ABC transporter permease [Actinoallomurus iriomotensis]GLY76097.1 sugar ABC transporter permease [Actinoallomurus iriomotensis]GLY87118.1 sugar ABC transporter permease [Actinoallomurus iriomotensis]
MTTAVSATPRTSRPPRLSTTGPRRRAAAAVAYLVLALVAIAFLLPFGWLFLASVSDQASLKADVPHQLTLRNFADVLTGDNLHALANSLVLSLGAAVLTLVLAAPAAYPLSRYTRRFGRPILLGLLFATGLPITAILVPVYGLFVQLELLDSIPATTLFLTATGLPMAIWMMKNFMDEVPIALEEAAWVDGASGFRALLRIVLPLMLPGTTVVFTFTFALTWGNFFVPFILLVDPAKQPASVAIYQYFGLHGTASYGLLAAFSILYSLPVVVLYTLVQRVLGNAFALSGGVKG